MRIEPKTYSYSEALRIIKALNEKKEPPSGISEKWEAYSDRDVENLGIYYVLESNIVPPEFEVTPIDTEDLDVYENPKQYTFNVLLTDNKKMMALEKLLKFNMQGTRWVIGKEQFKRYLRAQKTPMPPLKNIWK